MERRYVMAKIAYFMICDTMNNVPMPGGSVGLNMVNPQLLLTPTYIPGNFSFCVVVGVRDVKPVNLNTDAIKLKFEFLTPQGKLLQQSMADLPMVKMQKIPDQYQGFLMSFDLRNLPIEEEGAYILKLYIDDEFIGEEEIPIFKKS